MCGRYTLAAGTPELVEAFGVPVPDFELYARYNIAPGQQAPVVAADRRGRRAGLLTWGLVPGWKDEPGKPLINARSESVHRRVSFYEPFARRRCLVPADGFYEWRKEGTQRIPYWVHSSDGGLLSFAGIWERWSRPGREPRHTFAILTMQASAEVAEIHDRMPVVIAEPDRAVWLDGSTGVDAALAIVQKGPAPRYTLRRVSERVNRPVEDDAGLLEEARD